MLFLMVFRRFPEKFSLGIFFSPSKPNTIRLTVLIAIVALVYRNNALTSASTRVQLLHQVLKMYSTLLILKSSKCTCLNMFTR